MSHLPQSLLKALPHCITRPVARGQTYRIDTGPLDHPIIAFGDIHGEATCFGRLLDHVLNLEQKADLVLLGDLIDRGPHSLETLSFIISAQEALRETSTPLIVLPGNHDELLLGTLDQKCCRYYKPIFLSNGGQWIKPILKGTHDPDLANRLLTSALWSGTQEILKRSTTPDLKSWLSALPLSYRNGRMLLVHAGTPNDIDTEEWIQNHPLLSDRSCKNEDTPRWLRYYGAPQDMKNKDGTFVVHGHTIDYNLIDTAKRALHGDTLPDNTEPRERLCLDSGSFDSHILTCAHITEGQATLYHIQRLIK